MTRKPIRFRIQNKRSKNDCAIFATATAIEQKHFEKGNKKVYFSPALFERYEEELREALGVKGDEPIRLPKALKELKDMGYIKSFKPVWKWFWKQYADSGVLLLNRKNFKGQKVMNGKWYVPPNAEEKEIVHFLVILDYDNGYIVQDSKYDFVYKIDDEVMRRVCNRVWTIQVP